MSDTVDKKTTTPPSFPAVQLVSLWALLTAGVFIASFALAYALLPPPSWTSLMTDDAEVAAFIGRGVAWCTAAQSATAALALLLPSRRRLCRRALAYAALVAAAANHATFWYWITLVVTSAGADPGRVAFWLWIIGGSASFAVLAAGDHMCFIPSPHRQSGVGNGTNLILITSAVELDLHPPWISSSGAQFTDA